MKKVLVLTNSINGLYNFRKELIKRLVDEVHEVIIAAPIDEKTSYFKKMGCRCIETSINRRGTNPITDLKLLLSYLSILRAIKPDVVLTYTIKPNVYGGLACRLLHIPYIANITGLGTSIENKGLVQKISLFLYKIGLRKAECVFFQNKTNKQFFCEHNIVKGKIKIIPGSGVNLEEHYFEAYPENNQIVKFLFIGRIMEAKGINELLQAAKKVRKEHPNVQFDLIGRSEENYEKILRDFEKNNIIRYHGPQSNVHSFIKDSHATINPSYHEGMSNVLLESASTGRPVIASNISGCKETFDEGISGFGFEVKNVNSLVEAIVKFINLPFEKKRNMGLLGREKMENEFDRNIVINDYLDEINRIFNEEK